MVRKKNKSPEKASPTKRKRAQASSAALIANKIFKVSQKIVLEIKNMQTNTQTQIPKLRFARLVREIMQSCGGMEYRIQGLALSALQEASEVYLVQYFEDSYACSTHARRITLQPRDMELLKTLRSRYEPFLL